MEDVSTEDAESSTNESDDVLPMQLVRGIGDDSKKVDTDTASSTNEGDDELKIGTEDQQRRPSNDGNSRSSPPVVEANSASISGNPEMKDWDDCQELEHLAGPRCEHSSGYCGFDISAEEMRGSTTLQCLVMKTPEWTPDPDDQEFERSGKYYLSGLCGQMPSRDMDGPTMTPPRHGADHIWADVVFWEGAEVSCFDGKPTRLSARWLTRVSYLRRAENHVHPCPSIQPASKFLAAYPVSAQVATMLSV